MTPPFGWVTRVRRAFSYVARIKVVLDANLLERHLFGRRRLIQHFPQEVVFCPFDRAIHVFEDLIG
jgi:hypothetical protein